MNIRERSDIFEIMSEINDLRLLVSRLNSRLSHRARKLTGTYAELGTALSGVTTAVSTVEMLIDRLVDEADERCERPQFSGDEVKRLQHLNHVMNVISVFMCQRSEAIRSSIDAKLADDSDPLQDFEIEAKIDYQLREDDPDFDENDDNFLSSRSESLRRDSGSSKILEDWRYSLTPEPFRSEPLSWLLHSLTEHSYGINAPRISLQDCLRIGTVFLDIQVWWQYAFDVDSGQWIKRWRKPGGMPEYAKDFLQINDLDR